MVDRKRVDELTARIRSIPAEKFNMETWWAKTTCGTVGCIAGHAADLFGLPQYGSGVSGPAWYTENGLLEMLGLTEEQADGLFVPVQVRLYAVTKADAILVLERLATTGKVDWSDTTGRLEWLADKAARVEDQ